MLRNKLPMGFVTMYVAGGAGGFSQVYAICMRRSRSRGDAALRRPRRVEEQSKGKMDMRKWVRGAVVAIALLTAAMMAVCFLGCSAHGPSKEPRAMPEGEELSLSDAMCTQSGSIPGYSGDRSEPPFVVHNIEELLEATGAEWATSCSLDAEREWVSLSDVFTDEFFAEKDLLCAHYPIGSGSIDVGIDWAVKTDDGYEVSFVEEELPEGASVTCDMAYWTAIIPIDKEQR